MKKELISFEIERLDPLGQGVSKINDKISFIPKTLPGEKGSAQLTGKKKGVHFAQAKEITNPSPERVEPECPHYAECSGCAYLHTSYALELQNKRESFERQISFSSFKESELECHAAPTRFGYRNRIQLHYDLKRKSLGYFRGKSQSIHKVNECLLPSKELKTALENLYENDSWLEQVAPHAPVQGHVELYDKDGSISTAWNQSYSSGGFSQVNEAMNSKALSLWQSFYEQSGKPKQVLDVFGGSGNLTRAFNESQVTIIDSYCDESLLSKHQRFLKADLYKNPEIPEGPTDLLIFDPPRSGFKEACEWIEKINPKFIGYQSCFSDTMIRDLKNIGDHWKVSSIHLLDFFPGTHHYEAIIFLENTLSK